ncbi:alanine--glyoxylate aminotransferase family protein [Chromobacterium haemolyticum]|uniref:Alanine--glyoxylate aminotransferase family protein n=1 Tax=Chromobacterium haemolyticum TaxID=394935 RepID=A0ABS3GLK9_9NEIS|nr:alanine--glyoxylate aminotransferase family protein [Chromobacterium haemolyticum]MBK0415921.1 alanine--glyoxylate aminotransferase family protein [Chromobacterium haemolyticum]MBO0415148.1 alanine--glyoxylate aminotransferase family protein [Chromobacterium haemolyticum]MBO0498409.1 alanine--glyoxylate aminotransferase family protein [Chromobacterium haemolyticum]QOD82183.1 alanine--glyoxylate aminotransferase family protein [Chromobacterium haemolyticum]BBH14787.1 serine--pyruvate aminotr
MLAAPQVSAFLPPRRILMGPGPSDVYPEVLAAQARPTVGHLDPLFVGMMDEVKSLLQYAFQTANPMTVALSAPGSAGMEACFVNLVEPGEKVIVCRNGVFGERMRQNVVRLGAVPVLVDSPWGQPVDPDAVESALKANPDARFLAFVHAETSTGALSDAKTLCALAKSHGCLSIVDAVTSLGGVELRVDEWGVDAVYSGSQKCLSCVPGLSPLSFSPAAVDKLQARQSPVPSWFLDQTLVMAYWGGGKRSYHHTAPVNALYALHESLRQLAGEGLEAAWQRHRDMHLILRDGLEKLGLKFVVDAAARLPQLNAVYIPEGIDDAAARNRLLQEYNLEIGGGLGDLAGKAWRIGLMGYGARRENVALCLKALESVLK